MLGCDGGLVAFHAILMACECVRIVGLVWGDRVRIGIGSVKIGGKRDFGWVYYRC